MQIEANDATVPNTKSLEHMHVLESAANAVVLRQRR